MKTKITMLFMTFAFILVFAPTVKAEAAAFRQTNATANSVTVSWDNTYNDYVQGYNIYIGSSNTPISVSSNTNSYTITGLQQGCAYSVLVLCNLNSKDYYFDSTSHNYIVVRTQPKKMTSKHYKVGWSKQNKITVKYTDESFYTLDRNTWYNYIDGVEFKVKDVNGKKRKTIQKSTPKTAYSNNSAASINSFSFNAPNAIKNKGMQYQLRTYIQLQNGKKIYSEWTTVKVLIPQAKITKLLQLDSDKVQVTWKKVSGAESYTIWTTSDSGESYDKVATVSGYTTSYTVSDLEEGEESGIVITAKVKVGKKKYNSTKSYYTYYN